MKKLAFLLLIPTSFYLISCGPEAAGGEGTDSDPNTETETTPGEDPVTSGNDASEDPRPDEEKAQDMTAAKEVVAKMDGMDLSEHGFDLIVKAPNGAISELMSWGAVEIRSGERFKLSISKGGDGLEVQKLDLDAEPLFQTKYLKEDGGNAILYSQEIPESGLPTTYHLFVEVKVGSEVYEIIDLDGNDFTLEEVQAMYEVAKTIKAKGGA